MQQTLRDEQSTAAAPGETRAGTVRRESEPVVGTRECPQDKTFMYGMREVLRKQESVEDPREDAFGRKTVCLCRVR